MSIEIFQKKIESDNFNSKDLHNEFINCGFTPNILETHEENRFCVCGDHILGHIRPEKGVMIATVIIQNPTLFDKLMSNGWTRI